MKSISAIWIILAVIAFIIAGVLVNRGFDKINNYYNSENYPSINENAYVGGDAYNYIINANYATGYFVLAMISVIAGFGFLLIGHLSQICTFQEQLRNEIRTLKTPWGVGGISGDEFKDLPEL